MKKKLVILTLILSYTSFSQSKKEQIEILTVRVDSLNQIIGSERSSNVNKLNELNSATTKLESQIADLTGELTKLDIELKDRKTDSISKQKELKTKQQEIVRLQTVLKVKSDSIDFIKKKIKEIRKVDITDFNSSDLVHPYKNDGYYTLEGSHETIKRRISDKFGNHIGVLNYNWGNFDESFYFEGSLFSGILYVVNNKRLAEIGQIKNGKKSGLWVKCISDLNSENLGLITEVSKFENGALIKRKVKDFSRNDESCSNTGYFDFEANNPKLSLTDINGLHPWSEDFNEEKGLYTSKRKPFSGIGYINESGACMTAIFNFENGHQKGFYILSGEEGYISSFGETGKTTGRIIENHYTGEIFKIENYTNNQSKKFSLFFNDEKYVGNANYENYQLINCKGTCE